MSNAKATRGRPRHAAIEPQVLRAAVELLLDGGVASCTVEAVSKHSGITKPTIYRRWPHRTALAIEAFAGHVERHVPISDTGDAVEDLVHNVVSLAQQYVGRDGVVFAELLAAAVLEPGTAALLNDRFFAPRRTSLRRLWESGVHRGQLTADADVDDVIDLLFGPLSFRLLLGHQPSDPEAAERLARAVLRSFVPRAGLTRDASPHHPEK